MLFGRCKITKSWGKGSGLAPYFYGIYTTSHFYRTAIEKKHVIFTAKLCDENESPLAQTEWNWEDLSKFTNAEVGKVFSFSFMTSNSYGDNMFEKDMNEVIGKIRKITILQGAR